MMLNEPGTLPMDQVVDTSWAEPVPDGPTDTEAPTAAAPVGAALVEALRTAARSAASRVAVGGADSPFAFVVGDGRIAPDGTSVEPPLDQLAAALALDSAAVSVVPDASPATAEALGEASIDLEVALAQALPLTAAWGEIMRIVPDDRARVALVARLPAGGVDVDDEQWRVVARIGAGRGVGELAPLLEIGHLAAMRSVHDLAVLGLVEVTAAPRLLPAPPPASFAAPAFAAPSGTPLAPPTLPPPGATAAPLPPLAAPLAAPLAVPATPEAALPLAPEPTAPAPAAFDDGWTTVSAAPGGDWSYERLTTNADDWLDNPDPDAAAAAWDEQVRASTVVHDDWSGVDTVDSSPTADLWADVPAESPAPAAAPFTSPFTSPAPVPAAAPVAPLVPARAVTPLPAYQRDEIPALPTEPAPAAATDEVLGSVVGEDELVNRALLFKFLSSMRD